MEPSHEDAGETSGDRIRHLEQQLLTSQRQISLFKADRVELNTQITQLQSQLQQSQEHAKEMEILGSWLATRVQELEEQLSARALASSDDSVEMQKTMGLTSEAICIEKFEVLHVRRMPHRCKLYLSNHNIYMQYHVFPTGTENVTVPISSVTSLTKDVATIVGQVILTLHTMAENYKFMFISTAKRDAAFDSLNNVWNGVATKLVSDLRSIVPTQAVPNASPMLMLTPNAVLNAPITGVEQEPTHVALAVAPQQMSTRSGGASEMSRQMQKLRDSHSSPFPSTSSTHSSSSSQPREVSSNTPSLLSHSLLQTGVLPVSDAMARSVVDMHYIPAVPLPHPWTGVDELSQRKGREIEKRSEVDVSTTIRNSPPAHISTEAVQKEMRRDQRASMSKSLTEISTPTMTAAEAMKMTECATKWNKLFSLPMEDYRLEFTAVIYTPLPIVGTLYVGEHHCCFYGKLITKEVVRVVPYTDIKSVANTRTGINIETSSSDTLKFSVSKREEVQRCLAQALGY